MPDPRHPIALPDLRLKQRPFADLILIGISLASALALLAIGATTIFRAIAG